MLGHGRRLTFEPDPDYFQIRMLEPDCFLQYLISDAMRNFTSGKSHVYVLLALVLHGWRSNVIICSVCLSVCERDNSRTWKQMSTKHNRNGHGVTL